MLGFFRTKKADVLQHWIAFAEGFQLVPSEFYDSVEKELESRKVPGMEMSRVEFSEGGLLSDDRVYLRMVRERLVFDVCAAPFGASFFFSCRFAEIPAVIKVWQLLALATGLGFCGLISLTFFYQIFGVTGLLLWPFAGMVFLAMGIYVLRNPLATGLRNIDALLIQTPLIGAVYEAFFRKDTYHRQDTRLMYLEVVSGVVKRLAEQAVAARGVTLVRQYEQSPILGTLYRPVSPSASTMPPKE